MRTTLRTGGTGGIALAVCAVTSALGRPPVLSVDDAVVVPGDKTYLVAYVEREPLLGIRRDVEDIKVRFQVDGEPVGDDRTNDDGRAKVKCTLASGIRRFSALATVDGKLLQATGRVFTWQRERVIIAVDVDDTIARTDYTELIFDDDEDEVDAHKRAAKTLERMAGDFHIVFLTARPRFLLEKTRGWLREKDFPAGPVITAKGLRQTARPERFKREVLKDLRKRWPTLLIGIGNSQGDARAYGSSKMLSIMLEPRDGDKDFGRHSIVLRGWKSVARLFDANRAVLTDPDQLERVIKGKGMLLQPVHRWESP
ncbi:MAG: hypothetical protein GY842_29255 [bacterium]|nr:hypothetical protein [bacterium]